MRRAIDEALRACYRDRPPVSVGAGVGVLAEVRAYLHPATSTDPQHWHYLTLGLTELDAKTSNDPARSGWGFELTMRVPATDGTRDLPEWPVLALAKLALHVEETAALADGHHVSLEGRSTSARRRSTGWRWRATPSSAGSTRAHWNLDFLQAVGITRDEADLVTRWSVRSFLDVLAKQTPLLLTRPERGSLLGDPIVRPMPAQRAEVEGTSETPRLRGDAGVASREGDFPRVGMVPTMFVTPLFDI